MELDAVQAFFSEGKSEGIPKYDPGTKKPYTPVLTAHTDRQKKVTELLKLIQGNIKASERLRSQINKDLRQGAALEEVLINCIECISLMTGDKVFYTENLKAIEARRE